MLVLLVVGLVVLGPERLPGAIRWTASALRHTRDYVTGVTSQLREDIGPEFDELREPLRELQKLRGMTPRAALTKHLLDGDDSLFAFDRPAFDGPGGGFPPAVSQPTESASTASDYGADQPAPFDVDAT